MTNTRAAGARYHAVRAVMHARFPAVFPPRGEPPVPVKVGLHRDLLALQDLTVVPWKLHEFLTCWCGRDDYLRVLRDGAERVGLDGAPCGQVTAEDEAQAAAVLRQRAAQRTARRKVTARTAIAGSGHELEGSLA